MTTHDRLVLCLAVREQPLPRPPTSKARGTKRPACNRTAGHDGPHRLYRNRDFAVLAEWTDDECQRQPINGGMPLSIFDWQDDAG